MIEGFGSIPLIDPDPGGPKTYGSDGSGLGSATLESILILSFVHKNGLSIIVPNLEPKIFVPPGTGFVIIFTDPDPSINRQKQLENLVFYSFVTSS